MDVERTKKFILQMQAKSEERMVRAEVRMDKFDRRMEAMGKLVQTGMKWLVKIRENPAGAIPGRQGLDRGAAQNRP